MRLARSRVKAAGPAEWEARKEERAGAGRDACEAHVQSGPAQIVRRTAEEVKDESTQEDRRMRPGDRQAGGANEAEKRSRGGNKKRPASLPSLPFWQRRPETRRAVRALC